MRAVKAFLALLLALGTMPAWAAGADAATEGESESRRVTVVGDVPPRPELQSVSGVTGWVVNGTEIPIAEVATRAAAYHGPYVLQDMVAEVLLEEEAKRQGVTVEEAEVGEKVKAFRIELGTLSEPAFESYLRAQRVTREWFENKARSYVLMEKVLADQVHVSDREVEVLYRQNQAAYRRNESVQFRVMAFTDKASAEVALAAVRGGRSFQEVAKGVAPTSAERAVAGELQFAERGLTRVPPEFEAALFAAPLNQVAGPVEVRGAYYLIRVEKKLDPRQFTLDEIRDVIREQIRRRKLEQIVWPSWIGERLRDADISVLKAE
jgi:foldase protein PrsA